MKKCILITVALIFLYSCSNDILEKTFFIPDAEDNNLPAYTELGYNSFGVKYERLYFTSSNDIVPCKIVYKNGVLTFSLHGRTYFEYYYRNSNYEQTSLTFSFPYSPLYEYKDLMVLRNTNIDLTDASCEVRMTRDSQTDMLNILSGHLTFKNTRLLSVDEKENRVILSGTFDLRFLRNEIPEIMSNGRFDLGLSDVFNLSDN